MIYASIQQMSKDVKDSAGQRLPLYLFVYGSMFVLLACLGVTAYVFSETYLERERSRAENYSRHIYDFFSFHSRTISQEMWSRNYDSIRVRVDTIAKDVGDAKYDLILTDENQNCVFSRSTLQNNGLGSGNSSAPSGGPRQQVQCKVPELLRTQIPKFSVDVPQAVVEYSPESQRYVYMAPITVGIILRGYLYASLDDPYHYYRGNNVLLIVRIFIVPICSIILAWMVWLIVSHRFILKPYLRTLVAMEKKQAVGEIAGELAHNIRAPAEAIKSVVKSLKGIGSTERKLLNSASSRIEHLANKLLTEFTQTPNVAGTGSFSFL